MRRPTQTCVSVGVKRSPHMQHAFEKRLAICVQRTLEVRPKGIPSIRKSPADHQFYTYPEAGSLMKTQGFSCRSAQILESPEYIETVYTESMKSKKLKKLKKNNSYIH